MSLHSTPIYFRLINYYSFVPIDILFRCSHIITETEFLSSKILFTQRKRLSNKYPARKIRELSILNRSPSSRQLKKYKFFLSAEIYLLAVFMRLASKFRVFPLVLKFRDSFVSVYCYSNLYNLRSFFREYLYR